MRVAVVYESLWGNTRAIAEEIAQGFFEAQGDMTVEVRHVGEEPAAALSDVDLLVVGAPTHMWGLSSVRSRKMGLSGEAKKPQPAEVVPGAAGTGVREWLKGLQKVTAREAATFDTRLNSRLSGGASRTIARRLRRRGYALVDEPTGFYVSDTTGPLKQGQRERARDWAKQLLASAARPARS